MTGRVEAAEPAGTREVIGVDPRFVVGGLAVAGTIIALGNSRVAPGEHGGLGPAVATAVLCAVLAGALFGLGLRSWSYSNRLTVTLAVLTVLSMVVFWSGAVGVLAAATASSRPRERRGATSLAVAVALAAAAVAIVSSVVSFVR